MFHPQSNLSIFPLKFKIHLLLIGRRSFISLVCIGTSNRGRLQSILLPSDFIYKSMPPKLSLKISLSALLDRSYWSLSRCFYWLTHFPWVVPWKLDAVLLVLSMGWVEQKILYILLFFFFVCFSVLWQCWLTCYLQQPQSFLWELTTYSFITYLLFVSFEYFRFHIITLYIYCIILQVAFRKWEQWSHEKTTNFL